MTKSSRITKVVTIRPERIMNVGAEFQSNTSSRCCDISVPRAASVAKKEICLRKSSLSNTSISLKQMFSDCEAANPVTL